jgi:hypothetical protein
MKTKLHRVVVTVMSLGALVGCGPSREEIERRERDRIEAEKQAQREIQKSNEAVNEVSKKLGRKPPSLDLGVSTQTQPTPPPPTQPKP